MEKDPHNNKQLGRFAATALQSMEEHNIPATPMNFTVWHNYHAGTDQDLVRGLDSLLENGIEFTEARNDEIYHKHFGLDRESEEVREATGRIEAAATKVLERLGEASKHAADYGEKLTEFSGDIASQIEGGDLRTLVEGILDETRRITEKNQSLALSLEDSTAEIALLRQHLEEVRQEALTDALTGVSNRKFFDMRLREEIASHHENGAALSLLLLDIDHFKKFNDAFGHQIGDKVLRVVGKLLKDGVKGRDAPARYGGEEFAVILPQTSVEDAAKVAEDLRGTLASRRFTNTKTGECYGTITVSVGVAQWRSGESNREFVQRADRALYRAKSDGRNRVAAETQEKRSLGLTG